MEMKIEKRVNKIWRKWMNKRRRRRVAEPVISPGSTSQFVVALQRIIPTSTIAHSGEVVQRRGKNAA